MTKLSNANPHRSETYLGLKYEKPRFFDQSISRGSAPLITCRSLQPQTEADVVPIEIVRLREAQRMAQNGHRRVDVNLDPYEEGLLAAKKGLGTKACPYGNIGGTEDDNNFDDWMMGYDAHWI